MFSGWRRSPGLRLIGCDYTISRISRYPFKTMPPVLVWPRSSLQHINKVIGMSLMTSVRLPDALRLSSLPINYNILSFQGFVGWIRRSRRIRHTLPDARNTGYCCLRLIFHILFYRFS